MNRPVSISVIMSPSDHESSVTAGGILLAASGDIYGMFKSFLMGAKYLKQNTYV